MSRGRYHKCRVAPLYDASCDAYSCQTPQTVYCTHHRCSVALCCGSEGEPVISAHVAYWNLDVVQVIITLNDTLSDERYCRLQKYWNNALSALYFRP